MNTTITLETKPFGRQTLSVECDDDDRITLSCNVGDLSVVAFGRLGMGKRAAVVDHDDDDTGVMRLLDLDERRALQAHIEGLRASA